MKIMVAGGAGFIGCHLCDRLVDLGNDVVCVDNFYLGRKANIEHLFGNPAFTFYDVDLCDFDELEKIFLKENIEYVFHLAANSDIQASVDCPAIELDHTYLTTFNLLECMRKYKVKRFFFSSTSAIYGDKFGDSVNEDAPLAPISYYGAAKMGSEALISAFSYMNDFKTLIFRFPNVIGPKLTHGVIFDFISRLRENSETLRILGNGQQTKPYIYVEDLIDGIVQFMNVEKGVETYNIGVESSTSVDRIADIICEEMGLTNVKYEHTGGKGGWKGDVPVFNYNLDKIHRAGWSAKNTSDESVRKTVRAELGK